MCAMSGIHSWLWKMALQELANVYERIRPAIIFVLLSSLAGVLPDAVATEPANWFHDAQWGVMTHYLGAPPSSNGGAELTAEA